MAIRSSLDKTMKANAKPVPPSSLLTLHSASSGFTMDEDADLADELLAVFEQGAPWMCLFILWNRFGFYI